MFYRASSYAIALAALIVTPLAKLTALPVIPNENSVKASDLHAGIYTNEEQVYFANESGEPAPEWLSYRVSKYGSDKYQLVSVNAYGDLLPDKAAVIVKSNGATYSVLEPDCPKNTTNQCSGIDSIIDIDSNGMTLKLANGMSTRLNLAREVECWAALKKDKPKADGSVDWQFDSKLLLHDQGGRAIAGGGDTGAPKTILKMRKVYWPAPSKNKPSLVLYIHKFEKLDTAESYSWADVDAKRIGINLRWMQASCGIAGTE